MRNEICKNNAAEIWKTGYAKVGEKKACMIICQFSPGLSIFSLSLRCLFYVPTLCEYLNICNIFLYTGQCSHPHFMDEDLYDDAKITQKCVRTNVSPNLRTVSNFRLPFQHIRHSWKMQGVCSSWWQLVQIHQSKSLLWLPDGSGHSWGTAEFAWLEDFMPLPFLCCWLNPVQSNLVVCLGLRRCWIQLSFCGLSVYGKL